MRTRMFMLLTAGPAAFFLGLAGSTAYSRPLDGPLAHAAAVCADYPNQAAAQRAHDTRDPDHDGVYCEDLPCPCLKPGQGGDGSGGGQGSAPVQHTPSCTTPRGVQPISFSATKYPHIKRHTERAIRHGWPAVLVINRPGEDARRDRLLTSWPTRDGYDRDEYPPAVGRGRGTGLTRGSHPRGMEGRRRVRPLQREPQPRLGARPQAAPLLQRHPIPLRLLLAPTERQAPSPTTGRPERPAR